MTPRRLEPREIDHICDVLETRISDKIRLDFRFEMELIKNEIMRAITSVPRNVGTEARIMREFGGFFETFWATFSELHMNFGVIFLELEPF